MKNNIIGSISNFLVAIVFLIFGIIYLFKNSFMPYHSKALSLDWNELENSAQFTILASMRIVSGVFIAISLMLFYLQLKFNLEKVSWIPGLILVTGLIVSLTTIYATMLIRLNTPGNPPTVLALLGIILLITGYVFNQKSRK